MSSTTQAIYFQCPNLNRIDFFGGRANLAIVDSLGKPKGIERLAKIVFSRGKVDKHQGFGIATQRVHEQVSEFWISVRYVAILKLRIL